MSDARRSFRHVVGVSTLKEGFAVPKSAEGWMAAPGRGQKRQIWLSFDNQRVAATLRRLDNEIGHVQVKYENRACEPFRNWLTSKFGTMPTAASGEFLELRELGEDCYSVQAFPIQGVLFPGLQIHEWLFHGNADRMFERLPALNEIPAVARTVEFQDNASQNHYNKALAASFRDWQWSCEGRVIPELGLKYDFAKDAVQVEVEFGNARTYYQDYVKFLLGHDRGTAKVGVLLVPTASFARHLCEVGRQRAILKGRSCYSGMIDFDKVRREFGHLAFMLTMPLAVGGLGPGGRSDPKL